MCEKLFKYVRDAFDIGVVYAEEGDIISVAPVSLIPVLILRIVEPAHTLGATGVLALDTFGRVICVGVEVLYVVTLS